MRAKYDDIWLTGLPWQEDVGPLRWQGQQAVSIIPLVAADSPLIRSFGNAAETLPVSVVLLFPSEIDAVAYCARILWDLPKTGTLMFIDQAGTDQVTITYPTAAFQTVSRMRDGRSVHLDYTFVAGGPPTITTVSDAPLRIETESGTPITTES